MTNNKSFTVNTRRGLGDIALDGLWPGFVGGLLMLIYLVLAGLLNGDQPLTVLGYFLPDESLPPLAGLATHLAVSAVHGIIFALLTAVAGKRLANGRIILAAGVLYSLLLWLTAVLIIIPSDLSGLGGIPGGHLLVGHLIYGAAMGLVLAKSRQSQTSK
jgi:hypothetical protein